MPTVHIIVEGKVQGVFFRATAKEVAEDLQITGWVKNMPEGHVEITATGNQQAIQQYIDWCHQGPSKAKVKQVQVTTVPDISFDHFSILRS